MAACVSTAGSGGVTTGVSGGIASICSSLARSFWQSCQRCTFAQFTEVQWSMFRPRIRLTRKARHMNTPRMNTRRNAPALARRVIRHRL
jgi:hypothetical protein